MLKQITPILITFNEEDNLPRSLAALAWATSVLVIDSGSSDSTLDICAGFSNVRVVSHPFTSFAEQCNFALQQNIDTDWVLSMDADYIVTPALRKELTTLQADAQISAYSISFQYLIAGKPLRGSLYPPRTCLYRKRHAHYEQDGHAHKVVIPGQVGELSAFMQHDDRKPKLRWLKAQNQYAAQEARKLKNSPWSRLSRVDVVRRLGLGPLLILPYTLFLKGLIINGAEGREYAKQRVIAEYYLWRKLFAADRAH